MVLLLWLYDFVILWFLSLELYDLLLYGFITMVLPLLYGFAVLARFSVVFIYEPAIPSDSKLFT